MTVSPHKQRAETPAQRIRPDHFTQRETPNSEAQSITTHIVDIEEDDGPRAAYAALQARLRGLREQGAQVPPPLEALERRLLAACCSESQGR